MESIYFFSCILKVVIKINGFKKNKVDVYGSLETTWEGVLDHDKRSQETNFEGRYLISFLICWKALLEISL